MKRRRGPSSQSPHKRVKSETKQQQTIRLAVASKTDNKSLYNELQQEIAHYSSTWCRGIKKEFIDEVLGTATLLAIGYEYSTERKVPVGMVVAESPYNDHPDEVHISLLCATPSGGRGGRILEAFLKHVEDEMTHIDYVTLSAVPSVINFYRKFGFINAERQCTEDPAIRNLISPVSCAKFTNEEAVNDPHFARFLEKLVSERLVSNKECQGIEWRQGSCSASGYEMTWCPQRRSL